MKRLILTLALCASAALPATAAAQSAPSGCQFVLGFQALHDMAPADVGDCTENQFFAANGDAQQHTTNGLLAWRKADNTTVFTNGATTWLIDPNGQLVSRANADRFPWEAADAAAAPADNSAAAPAASPTPAPAAPGFTLAP